MLIIKKGTSLCLKKGMILNMEKVEENNTNKKVRKEASSGLIITAIVLSYFIGFVTGFFVINNAIV